MAKTAATFYLSVAIAMTGCGAGPQASPEPLTLRASVNNGVVRDVSPPHHVLQMPSAGVIAIVKVDEGERQVAFSLQPGTCGRSIDIAPAVTAMQQKVTDIRWGFDCKANVKAADGSTSTLEIFADPPP